MSTPRTPAEIAAEIAALNALKPTGRWARKTAYTIELIIQELEDGFDYTSDEWDELPEEMQYSVNMARAWKEGMNQEKPSEDWGALVEGGA